MNITYTVDLNYGEDDPDDNEATPNAEDIARWINDGMAREGIPSADVTCERQ